MTSVKSIYGDKEQASEVREVFGRHRGADVPGCPPSRFTIFSRPGRSPPPARSPQPPLPRLRRSQFWVQKYERDARKNWDIFYKNHQEKFFKDRHYLAREFPHIFPEGLAVGGGGGDSDADADDPDARADADDEAPARSSNVTQTSDGSSREVGPAPRYVRPPLDPTRPRVFLEVGCGAGNTAFPLLEVDPHAIVYCCDFSPRAVELVRKRCDALPPDQAARVHPFVCDITREPLSDHVPRGTVDVCTMVFVLSAVSPEKMSDALRNVSSTMRPNGEGRVLLRDYAAGDLAQERFAARDGQRLSENFYVRVRDANGTRLNRPPARHVRHPRKRPALTPPILTILLVSNQGDGTRAFYFTPPGLRALFSARGMALEELDVYERTIANRGRGLRMDRRWIQASFASAAVPAEPLPPPPPPPEPEWMARKREADARRAAAEAKAAEERAELARVHREKKDAAVRAVRTRDRADLERALLGLMRDGVVTADELERRVAGEEASAS